MAEQHDQFRVVGECTAQRNNAQSVPHPSLLCTCPPLLLGQTDSKPHNGSFLLAFKDVGLLHGFRTFVENKSNDFSKGMERYSPQVINLTQVLTTSHKGDQGFETPFILGVDDGDPWKVKAKDLQVHGFLSAIVLKKRLQKFQDWTYSSVATTADMKEMPAADTPPQTNGRARVRFGDSIYDGYFVDGVRHGECVEAKHIDGKVFRFEGYYYKGERAGGTVHYMGHERYTEYRGSFITIRDPETGEVRCLRHGHGTIRMVTGMVYTGNFDHGQPSGHGQLTKPSSVFEGEFARGKKNGKGKLTEFSGTEYEGEWKDDKKVGEFTEKEQDGTVYKARYVEGTDAPVERIQLTDHMET